eukprot:TRINITY_DN1982_c0_g1_i1.p1 TRINITY_DN1982_c0_g1~~TRINITY_DN1982_c0_g1_i1.p1  ORF type:complete len:281 (-),score=32.21 TRINITY_DN1982_c0_g1_i1:24-866(-)
MTLELASESKCFEGMLRRYSHFSESTKCKMNFSVFLPPNVSDSKKAPVIWFLSGLTCTDENFVQKSGALKYASERGVALISPDTSPRGCGIPGETDSWDFGVGAGFYLNATEPAWSVNYNMFTYVTEELPKLIFDNLPLDQSRQGICGHSMGGHGSLVCAFKNPGKYKSASAFAPISNPMECPWGKKAFSGYLGTDQEKWKQWDATQLVASYTGPELHLLVDQGTADKFLKEQLLPQNLKDACEKAGIPLNLRMQEGYDHSYYFISTFIADHIAHHIKYL